MGIATKRALFSLAGVETTERYDEREMVHGVEPVAPEIGHTETPSAPGSRQNPVVCYARGDRARTVSDAGFACCTARANRYGVSR